MRIDPAPPINDHLSPGLYLHVPFCRSKCPYCGFYSLPSSALVSRWKAALCKEVDLYRKRFDRFDTIYFGGGTPTLLEVNVLENIVDHLFSCFDFAADTEITIEANPCDLTCRKMKDLKALGFNRISLGVQSFDDRTLAFLGRRHSSFDAERSLEGLRASGFDNLGIDLMYGFEGQTLADWADTLEKALSFRPEHLSCYQLTIEAGTPFQHLKRIGKLKSLGEEEEHAFFMKTSQFLEDHGYVHYEVSNFARTDGYRSRHNRKYWYHFPYLGLGPSAHSFSESSRWWNVRSVETYCEMLEDGRAPVEDSERLTEEQVLLESISLGARTSEGFDLSLVSRGPQTQALARLQETGFLRIREDRVVPTRKGLCVADSLPLYF